MKRTVEHKGSYDAVDDKGQRHRINVYVEVMHVSTLSGPTQRVEGLQTHKMASNGGHVNVNDDGTVEEVSTGRLMRPVSAMPA